MNRYRGRCLLSIAKSHKMDTTTQFIVSEGSLVNSQARLPHSLLHAPPLNTSSKQDCRLLTLRAFHKGFFWHSFRMGTQHNLPPACSHAQPATSPTQNTSKQLRQGTPHTSAPNVFNGVEGRVMQRSHMLAHVLPLLWGECAERLGGHGHHRQPPAVLQLHDVAAHSRHLLLADFNHLQSENGSAAHPFGSVCTEVLYPPYSHVISPR